MKAWYVLMESGRWGYVDAQDKKEAIEEAERTWKKKEGKVVHCERKDKHQKLSAELVALAEGMTEEEEARLARNVAAALGYRSEGKEAGYWRLTSRRDYVEIQLHFAKDGVELYALSLDMDSQETLAEGKVRGTDAADVVREARRVKDKAVGSPLAEHLRSEEGLNAGSLVGPMSAEEKDAEAGPKEGPPAMAQPLRSRRDYGEVASRVARSVAAGTKDEMAARALAEEWIDMIWTGATNAQRAEAKRNLKFRNVRQWDGAGGGGGGETRYDLETVSRAEDEEVRTRISVTVHERIMS